MLAGYFASGSIWPGSTNDPAWEGAVENSVLERTGDVAGSDAMVLLKPKSGPFQKPLPGASEYRPVYDPDDQEAAVKAGVISSVRILPGQNGTDVRLGAEPVSTTIGGSEQSGAGDEAETFADAPLFEDDDLIRFAEFGADVEKSSSMIGAVGVGLDLRETLSDLISPSPSVSPSPSPTPKNWYEGQIRGYSLLYLMHPAARNSVNRQIQILIDSRVRRIYLGVLVDGTFSVDYPFLGSVLDRLHRNGNIITLGLFLSNGPAMRNESERERARASGGFNRFDPDDFREKIQFDTELREQFRRIARNARAVFLANASLSRENANIAYVMLEDNLNATAYLAMRDIAGAELGDIANFIRNPCPGCYEGNDFDPNGDGLEFHDPQLIHALQSSDGFSIDGRSLFFPGEFDPIGLSVGDVQTLMRATLSRGVAYFALWRAQRQGIRGDRVPPDERVYEIPTDTHAEIEIELLRFGLTETAPEQSQQEVEGVRSMEQP